MSGVAVDSFDLIFCLAIPSNVAKMVSHRPGVLLRILFFHQDVANGTVSRQRPSCHSAVSAPTFSVDVFQHSGLISSISRFRKLGGNLSATAKQVFTVTCHSSILFPRRPTPDPDWLLVDIQSSTESNNLEIIHRLLFWYNLLVGIDPPFDYWNPQGSELSLKPCPC